MGLSKAGSGPCESVHLISRRVSRKEKELDKTASKEIARKMEEDAGTNRKAPV
jgi:hypothetical protein